MMHNPGSGLYTAPTAPSSGAASVAGSELSASSTGPSQTAARPALPDPNVTANSIEDAYASFILCCNPVVLPGTDTTALREAFRTPPRSDGRCFSIYTLYLLIRQLEDHTIKTWAELALKLGVEPPDQDKGQSSQKIQQYAVRLKRWMHSMHIDAFFDYLMGRSHPYWTEIPSDNYPISELLRDGVAAKDDMALRALIPEIKPRRGRRRDDEMNLDNSSTKGSQHSRFDDLHDHMSATAPGSAATNRWPLSLDGSGMYSYQPTQAHVSPSDINGPGQSDIRTPSHGSPWATNPDVINTSMNSYPWSTITPSTTQGFRNDEPKPAVPPLSGFSPRRPGRRHGAKVVSSAWRSNGSGGSGKTRGRPPIHRSENHHPPLARQDASSSPVSTIERTASPVTSPLYPTTASYLSHMRTIAPTAPLRPHSNVDFMPTMNTTGASTVPPPPISFSTSSSSTELSSGMPQRESPPGRLSLQVPERKGGDVHLASPHLHGMTGAELSGAPGLNMHAQGIPSADDSTLSPIAMNNLHNLQNYGATQLGMPPTMSYGPHNFFHGSHQTPYLNESLSSLAGVNKEIKAPGVPSITSSTPTSIASEPNIDNIHKPASSKNARIEDNIPSLNQSRFGSGSSQDRTNMDELEALFMSEISAATWYNENDQKIEPCSVAEASALVDIIINDLNRAAGTKEEFLINLAALAGGRVLMADTDVRIKRIEQNAEYTKYDCSWELRYGDVRGQFSIQEAVPHAYRGKLTTDVKAVVAHAVGLGHEPMRNTGGQSAATHPNLFTRPSGSSASPLYDTTAFFASQRFEDHTAGATANNNSAYQSQSNTPFSQPVHFDSPVGASSGGGIAGASGTSASPETRMGNTGDDNAALAAHWERKYRHLLDLLHMRDQQLVQARAAVLRDLQNTY